MPFARHLRPPSRRRRAFLSAALAALLVAPVPARAQAPCASADPSVPAPAEEIPGFPYRRALTPELGAYVQAVDAATDRVVAGTFATSWRGTPLRYALVSSEENLTRLPHIVRDLRRLRDPRVTTPARAAALARSTPAIVWYTGNVHGNETSGADAAVDILYRLAAGGCEVEHLLDDLVIGIIPTQNPDGRDDAARTNAYGFDMNRDWFARTQPETDGKLDLLQRYPPVLFIDAHEMGSSDFFFPPNADPIHHEISPQSLHWINDYYAKAMTEAFDERRQTSPTEWDHFSYDIYDLFYMGYGDSVPSTAFTSAGMTFEKGTADPDHQRELEQFVAGWTSLQQAALHKRDILRDWYRAHATALDEGRRGFLEPNVINEPGNTIDRPVPPLKVRHYFIGAGRASADAHLIVDRLLRTGVEVHRLRRPLRVPHLRGYGRAPRAGVVPAGSYWIPMAQPQKRWIQALLGEDPYTPFPYFYDVTAWSQPLLANLDAWFTGDALRPRADRVRSIPPPGVAALPPSNGPYWFPGDTGRSVAAAVWLARRDVPVRRLEDGAGGLPRGTFLVPASADTGALVEAARTFGIAVAQTGRRLPAGRPFLAPRVALYRSPASTLEIAGAGVLAGGESDGHLRYLLDQVWRVPYDTVSGLDILLGGLADADVLLVPGVDTTDLEPAAPAIRDWIENGGVFVGTARPGGTGGTPFAVGAGFTSAAFADSAGLQVPGTMFRVGLDPRSRLTLGAPRTSYWYHLGEDVLRPSVTGRTVGRFPSRAPEFWFSGYAEGTAVLQGSAALVHEGLGAGQVVLFSGEPNYRAYTDGPSLLLANALALPAFNDAVFEDVGSPAAAEAVRAARASVREPIGPGRPLQIVVAPSDAGHAARVLRGLGAQDLTVRQIESGTLLVIPNPLGLDREQHPFVYRLLLALRDAGVEVRSAIL